MLFGEILTFSGIAFMLILLSVYFSKPTIVTLKTRFFRILVLLIAFYIVSELLPVYYLKYAVGDVDFTNSVKLITKILWRIHWIVGIVWFIFFFMYSYIIAKKIEVKSMFKLFTYDIITKVLSIAVIIFVIVYPFLPFEMLNIKKMNYLPGTTAIVVFIFVFLISLFAFYLVNKYKENVKPNERKGILIVLILVILAFLFQLIFITVSVIPFSTVLFAYTLYFYIENPDLIIMEEITNAQGNIEKSNQTKTDFLSNMTYEIKVPMNLISSLCDELVNMSVFDEKIVREDIDQIQTSGNNLLDIINNILDVSKIESGKSTLQEREYSINEMLSNIINIAKSKIGAKPVKLVVNVDQNISSGLYGDSAKLYQSLINIMGNAVKYTDVGRITFTLTSTKNSGIEHLLFKISDTGTGIKDEDKEKLFSKFTRLDNAVENEIEGSGLGLVITKEYIEAMGGKIWYDTQYRVGTTFFIDVPQKIVDARTLGETANTVKAEVSTEKIDCSKYKALIVDDNNLNIKVAKRLLEGYKFQIESVTTGKDCVYKIKEGETYDIIFMDHMMPEMDGIETLHVLKKLDGYQLPPIVALTANAIAGMKEMYLNEGFDDYLSKPINTNELDRVINRFFNKQ
ncbi:MAG: response regulator [Bacilli bacterium]|nr:response regulator [Bacilli bacterium]